MAESSTKSRSTAPKQGTDRGIRKMSAAEKRYLMRGLNQPGGKLPLFDRLGQRIPDTVIEACIKRNWCERWANNPIKPDWLVCRLTDKGREALDRMGVATKAKSS